MTTRTLLFLVIATTWAGLHNLALFLELYWLYWWFDLPMHFFGGVVVAMGFLVLADLRLPVRFLTRSLLPMMLAVLAVVIFWELFELWAGIEIQTDFIVDTTIDIVLGVVGGGVGYYLGERLRTL